MNLYFEARNYWREWHPEEGDDEYQIKCLQALLEKVVSSAVWDAANMVDKRDKERILKLEKSYG